MVAASCKQVAEQYCVGNWIVFWGHEPDIAMQMPVG